MKLHSGQVIFLRIPSTMVKNLKVKVEPTPTYKIFDMNVNYKVVRVSAIYVKTFLVGVTTIVMGVISMGVLAICSYRVCLMRTCLRTFLW